MGKLTGIVVNEGSGKTASAHDLRRSFGHRWAPRLMPIHLMSLMRHENIQTTMDCYVDIDPAETAEKVWKEYRNVCTTAEKVVGPQGFEP